MVPLGHSKSNLIMFPVWAKLFVLLRGKRGSVFITVKAINP